MTSGDGGGEDFDVMVIRVWREPDADVPFRARVTCGREDATTVGAVVDTAEDVVETVRRWLADPRWDRPSR